MSQDFASVQKASEKAFQSAGNLVVAATKIANPIE